MEKTFEQLYSELSQNPDFQRYFEPDQESFRDYVQNNPNADQTIQELFGIAGASETLKKKETTDLPAAEGEGSSLPSLSVGQTENVVEPAPVGGTAEVPPVGPRPGMKSGKVGPQNPAFYNIRDQYQQAYRDIEAELEKELPNTGLLNAKLRTFSGLYNQFENHPEYINDDYDYVLRRVSEKFSPRVENGLVSIAPKTSLRAESTLGTPQQVQKRLKEEAKFEYVNGEKFRRDERGFLVPVFETVNDRQRAVESYLYNYKIGNADTPEAEKLASAFNVAGFLDKTGFSIPVAITHRGLIEARGSFGETFLAPDEVPLVPGGAFEVSDGGNVFVDPNWVERQASQLLESEGFLSDAVLDNLNRTFREDARRRGVEAPEQLTREDAKTILLQQATRLIQREVDGRLLYAQAEKKLADQGIFFEAAKRQQDKEIADYQKSVTEEFTRSLSSLRADMAFRLKPLYDAYKAKTDELTARYKARIDSELNEPGLSYLGARSRKLLIDEDYLRPFAIATEEWVEQRDAIEKEFQTALVNLRLENALRREEKEKYFQEKYGAKFDELKKQFEGAIAEVQLESYDLRTFGKKFFDTIWSRTGAMYGGIIESITAANGVENNFLADNLKFARFVEQENNVPLETFSDVVERSGVFSGEAIENAILSVAQQGPIMAAGILTSLATLNPYAGGLVMWTLDSAQQAGDNYREKFEETGSVVQAQEVSKKTWKSQLLMIPLYAIESLPYVKGGLGKWGRGTGVVGAAKKVSLSIAAEQLPEWFQTLGQGYTSYTFRTPEEELKNFGGWFVDNGYDAFIDVLPASLAFGVPAAVGQQISERRTESKKQRVVEALGRMGLVDMITTMNPMIGANGLQFVAEQLYHWKAIDLNQMREMKQVIAEVVETNNNVKGIIEDADAQRYYVQVAMQKKTLEAELNSEKGRALPEAARTILQDKITDMDVQLKAIATNKDRRFSKVVFRKGGDRVFSNQSVEQALSLAESGQQSWVLDVADSDDITIQIEDSKLKKRFDDFVARRKAAREERQARRKQEEQTAMEAEKPFQSVGPQSVIGMDQAQSQANLGTTVDQTEKVEALRQKYQGTDRTETQRLDDAARLQPVLDEVAPGVKIVMMEDAEYQQAATNQGRSQSDNGSFFFTRNADGSYSGEVYININRANDTTIAHETAHAILLTTMGANPEKFNQMAQAISTVLPNDEKHQKLREMVQSQIAGYFDFQKGEEFLVELAASIGESNLDLGVLQKIAAAISKFVSDITGGRVNVFSALREKSDIVDFFNALSRTLATGQVDQRLRQPGATQQTTTQQPVPGQQSAQQPAQQPVDATQPAPGAVRSQGNFDTEGVSELYNSVPRLGELGSMQDYIEHLGSVFPNSTTRRVLYHGTKNSFEVFDKNKRGAFTGAPSAKLAFFFSSDRDNSVRYAMTYWGGMIPQKKQYLNLSLEEMKNYEEEASRLYNNVYKKKLEEYRVLFDQLYTLKDDLRKEQAKNLYEKVLTFFRELIKGKFYKGAQSLMPLIRALEDEVNNAKSVVDSIHAELLLLETKAKDYVWVDDIRLDKRASIKTVILNTENPHEVSDKGLPYRAESFKDRILFGFENSNDSVIIRDTMDPLPTDVYAVFEPEQIYELGTEADITKFQQFLEGRSAVQQTVGDQAPGAVRSQSPFVGPQRVELKNFSYTETPSLTVEEKVLQREAAKLLDDNFESKIQEYYDNYAGPYRNVISADEGKRLIPFYNENPARMAHVVHSPVSEFMAIVYMRKLEDLSPGDEVLILAGGAGAGKTTAIEKLGAVQQHVPVIVDTNLAGVQSAEHRIIPALEKGLYVNVNYVYRPVAEAILSDKGGVITRMEREGRSVPFRRVIETHLQSFITARYLFENQEKYKQYPGSGLSVKFVDNSKSLSEIAETDIPTIEDYFARDFTQEKINSIYEELEQKRAAGRFTEDQIAGSFDREGRRFVVDPRGTTRLDKDDRGGFEKGGELRQGGVDGLLKPPGAVRSQNPALESVEATAAALEQLAAEEPITTLNFEINSALEDYLSEKYRTEKSVVFHGSPEISYLTSVDVLDPLNNTSNAESKYVYVNPNPAVALSYSKSYNGYRANSGVGVFRMKGKKYVMKKSDILSIRDIQQNEAFLDGKRQEGFDYVEIPQDGGNIAVLNNAALDLLGVERNTTVVSEAYHKAKSDGSNPGLVNAVEQLLGDQAPGAVRSQIPTQDIGSQTTQGVSRSQRPNQTIAQIFSGAPNHTLGFQKLIEAGYNFHQIQTTLGTTILPSINHPQYANAYSKAVKKALKLQESLEQRVNDARDYIEQNLYRGKLAEDIYWELIARGYMDYEVYVAFAKNGVFPDETRELFGPDFHKTIETILEKENLGVALGNIREMLKDSPESVRVGIPTAEAVNIINQLGYGIVEPSLVLDAFLDYVNSKGVRFNAAAFVNKLKEALVNDSLDPDVAVNMVQKASDLFSMAGGMLQLARAFVNEVDMVSVIDKKLEKEGVVLTAAQKAKLKGLINDVKSAQRTFDEDIKTLKGEYDKYGNLKPGSQAWTDSQFKRVAQARANLETARTKLAIFLGDRKVILWNDRVNAMIKKGLLSPATTMLSIVANIEIGVLNRLLPGRAVGLLRDWLGAQRSGMRSNPYSPRNTWRAYSFSSADSWGTMTRSARYGNVETNEQIEKYFDNVAGVNFFKDPQWLYSALNVLIRNKTGKSLADMTPEELADAYDLTLTKIGDKPTDVELRDGVSYNMLRTFLGTFNTNVIGAVMGGNPAALVMTGPLAAEVTGRLMAFGGDILAGNIAAKRAMIDYVTWVSQDIEIVNDEKNPGQKKQQPGRAMRGVLSNQLFDSRGKLDAKALQALTTILGSYSTLRSPFDEVGLKRSLLADNPVTDVLVNASKGVRKKARELYMVNRKEKTGSSIWAELRRQGTAIGLKKTGFQVADVFLTTLVPFARVPVNFVGQLAARTLPAVAFVKYINSEMEFRRASKQFDLKYPASTVLDSPSKLEKYEKAKIELFLKKRQVVYDTTQLINSFLIFLFTKTAIMAGAVTTRGGEDEEEAKSWFGVRSPGYNITKHMAYLRERGLESLALLLPGVEDDKRLLFELEYNNKKPKSEKVIGTGNLGFIGLSMNIHQQYQINSQKSKEEKRIAGLDLGAKDYMDLNMLLAYTSATINNLPALQGIDRLQTAVSTTVKGEPGALQKFIGTTAATALAGYFPGFGSVMSKGRAEYPQNTREIYPSVEQDWSTSMGYISLELVQRLNPRYSFGEKLQSDFYKARIGPFGEDLSKKVTVGEPGTLEAYVQAMIDPFGLSTTPKEGEAYRTALSTIAELQNMAVQYYQATGRFFPYTEKGVAGSSFYSALTHPQPNKFAYEPPLGSANNPPFPYNLPNDLYREYLKTRGEHVLRAMRLSAFTNQLEEAREYMLAQGREGAKPGADWEGAKQRIAKKAADMFAEYDKIMTEAIAEFEKQYVGEGVSPDPEGGAKLVSRYKHIKTMIDRGLFEEGQLKRLKEVGFPM